MSLSLPLFDLVTPDERAPLPALLTARAVPYRPQAKPWRDGLAAAYCVAVAGLVLAMMGMAVFASFAKFWPYDLRSTLAHCTMGLVDAEVGATFANSLAMAAGTAVFGTVLVFSGAYPLLHDPKFLALLLRIDHDLAGGGHPKVGTHRSAPLRAIATRRMA